MDRTISGLFWLLLYLLIVLVPVFLMLAPPAPSGRPFLLEFAVALGFVGLTQIGLQFILIARFRRVTAPYGIDIILRYHRQIALVAVAAVLLHPVLILVDTPARIALFNPLAGNWASRLGLLSVALLVVTVISSIFRERLRIDYERWRVMHLVLGVGAIVAAQVHVSLAGLYTNTPWKQAVWIGMAVVMVGLVIYLRLLKPVWQQGKRWRVVDVVVDRGDTFRLAVEPDGHDGFRFAPGQFAWVKLAGSPFTVEEHPFSFTSSAEQEKRVEFGIRALGDFSGTIGEVPAGTRAYLDGPHGAFSLDRYAAAGYVFLAGGIGITPFISMLRTMADRGDRRPVTLIYADKGWDDVAYREDLARLEDALELTVVYVLEEPPADWTGEEGMVTGELLERRLPDDRLDRNYMICGPPPMMDAVEAALRERGVRRARIQLERFALA